jgi:hypothetical protein
VREGYLLYRVEQGGGPRWPYWQRTWREPGCEVLVPGGVTDTPLVGDAGDRSKMLRPQIMVPPLYCLGGGGGLTASGSYGGLGHRFAASREAARAAAPCCLAQHRSDADRTGVAVAGWRCGERNGLFREVGGCRSLAGCTPLNIDRVRVGVWVGLQRNSICASRDRFVAAARSGRFVVQQQRSLAASKQHQCYYSQSLGSGV